MLNQKFRQMIKVQSETQILSKGWRISYWMPKLGGPNWRELNEIKARMAVMHAMIYLAFKATFTNVLNWLVANTLIDHLTQIELSLLNKPENRLTQNDRYYLLQYIESLWALMWATKMAESLSADQFCADNMAQMLPNIYANEDNVKINELTRLRGIGELYGMLDYYQRVHWFCLDEVQSGKKLPVGLDESVVTNRYKALLWLYNKNQYWDNIQLI